MHILIWVIKQQSQTEGGVNCSVTGLAGERRGGLKEKDTVRQHHVAVQSGSLPVGRSLELKAKDGSEAVEQPSCNLGGFRRKCAAICCKKRKTKRANLNRNS